MTTDPSNESDTGRSPVRRETFGWLTAQPMLYPNAYVWLVFVSAMDVMLTWRILEAGGTEVNPIARAVIEPWGLGGAIAFKFGLILFVIGVTELAGRQRDRLGRFLAYLAVGLSAAPVAYSLALLLYHTLVIKSSPLG